MDDLKLRISSLGGYDVYRGIKIKDVDKDEINEDDYNNGINKVDLSVKLTNEEKIEALQKTILELQKIKLKRIK